MTHPPHHATIRLEHSYSAPIERVFSEFATPIDRARWSAPSDATLIYDQADFRPGGTDIFRCGPKANPNIRGETHYLHIVPNTCVVSSETLDMDGKRLAVSLTTLEFKPIAQGASLLVTIQIVSFVGPDMIRGYETGNQSALEQFSQHLRDIPGT